MENGAGKTTLLRLIWNLLSAAPNRGHRTELREFVFKRLEVGLSDGTEIVAEKPRPSVKVMTITVSRQGNEPLISEWTPDTSINEEFVGWDEELIRAEMVHFPTNMAAMAEAEIQRSAYIKFLDEIQVLPYFLADDRRFYSDDEDRESESNADLQLASARQRLGGQPRFTVNQELRCTLRRASNYLQSLAVGGATTGSANINAVYLDVLKGLRGSSLSTAHDPDFAKAELARKLADLGRRSIPFEQIGLVPRFVSGDFVAALTRSRASES